MFETDDPTRPLARSMAELDGLTRRFGQTLSRSLAEGIVEGRNLGEVMRGLGDQLLRLSLRQAEGALAGGLNAALQTGLSGLTGLVRPETGASGLFGGAPSWSAPSAAPASPAPIIQMQVHAQDAGSFLRAEHQVSAALARAVARGQRSL
ncbi:MAG: hypothetical protein O9322_03840 [Beijerinckiaceae bacterium]|nr:hypothetical protein [Beijerinckiaceae bacterium]MCZ8298649.1 hypothetical protein [Beijerinckiaceae bacterium]